MKKLVSKGGCVQRSELGAGKELANDAALVKQVHLQDGNSIMVATTPQPITYVVASAKKGEEADLMPSVLLASRVSPHWVGGSLSLFCLDHNDRVQAP